MSKAAQLSSKEIHKQLANLGIEVNISGVRLEYQQDVVNAIKLFMSKFPEFYTSGLIIREAYMWELSIDARNLKSWISCTKPIYRHGKLMVVVLLNPIWFKSKKLKKQLAENLKTGFAVYSTVVGNICHELGHVLWYQLIAYSLFQKLNQNVTRTCFTDFKTEIANRRFLNNFRLNTCICLKISNTKNSIRIHLSEYAAENSVETFAEAIAAYCILKNSNNFVKEMVNGYRIEFKQQVRNITN